jgi:NADPH2:quinone reductase
MRAAYYEQQGYPIASRYLLDRIADAQDAAERTGAAGRVVVEV